MKIQQLSKSKNYLYEGLDYNGRAVMSLWESAGIKLKEAQLTPDQINSLFAEVEKASTDAGGNRTALGMGKDALSAVNKAWEDLKTKVQDSKPIKNVDSTYDSVIAKIEAGLGGPDNAVSKVIMGYRKFAKEHPIAQGLIYSVLIAAAGISGAGLGGAAVLGLLKMADKLLQGEKFSSAAYSGAKTGAMAYGASKIGDYVKGKMADKDAFDAMGDAQAQRQALGQPDAGGVPPDIQKGLAADQAFQDRILNKFPPDKGYTFDSAGKSLQVFDANGTKVFASDIPLKTMDVKTFADLTNNGQMATPGISSGSISSDAMAGVSDTAKAAGKGAVDASTDIASKAADVATDAATKPFGAGMSSDYLQRVVDAGGKSGVRFKISPEDAEKALAWKAKQGAESLVRSNRALSEGQVYLVFNRVCTVNNAMLAEGRLVEGPMDAIKGFASKAMDKARTIGTNLTTKVTADKLNSAWQKAGAPTDSNELADFLYKQKINPEIIKGVYSSMKLPAPGSAPAAPAVDIEAVKKMIATLPTDRKVRLLKSLEKGGTVKPAAPAAPEKDSLGRIEPTLN